MAVFLCAFAAATLMNLPVMALRPMPGTCFAAFFAALFLAMVVGYWLRIEIKLGTRRAAATDR